MPVFANMKQMINVTTNLLITSNELGSNNDCYDKVRHKSCYDEAGGNSCYDKADLNRCQDKDRCYNKAGRIGILLRILRPDL